MHSIISTPPFTSTKRAYTFKAMMETVFPTTAAELGKTIGAELVGDGALEIVGMKSLDAAGSGSLTFFAEKKYEADVQKLKAVTVLVSKELLFENKDATFLVVENPKKIFAELANQFKPKCPWVGVSTEAIVHPSAKIGEGVSIGPRAIICEDVVIGAYTVVYPGAYIGPGVKIGNDCEVHPYTVLLTHVEVGSRVKIFAGSVIGSEGFGFLESAGAYSAIPQIGKVVIEDDVRIGAKCTIDRSTFGETVIGAGTKIDDQVHIGHNCRIGKNCILCAQVGLAGSTILEDGVILAGQVGLGGHMTVGKGAILGGQTGAGTNLKGGERYLGSPAAPLRESLRSFKYSLKLPELFERVKKLEQQIGKST